VLSPPTMEYVVAALLFPFRHLHNIAGICQGIVVYLPPFIGAAAAVLVFFFIRRTFGVLPAVAAAIVLAISPEHVEATCLGRFDNEMLEPLLLLLVIGSYSKSYQREGSIRSAIAAGLMSAVYLTIWRGAVFPLSIIGMDMLLRVMAPRTDDPCRKSLGKFALYLYLTPALFVSVVCTSNIWGSRNQISFNTVSWFHVILFVTAALLLFVLDRLRQKEKPQWQLAAVAVGIIAAVAALFSPLSHQFGAGISVVAGGNAWIDSIAQYQTGIQGIDFLKSFGLLIVVLPLGLFLLRSPLFAALAAKRLLIIWTLFMMLATLARARYAEYLPLNLAVMVAVTVVYLQRKWETAAGFQAMAAPATLVAILLCQSPTWRFFTGMYHGNFTIKGDVEETMLWLRDHTPPAGDYLRPALEPQYGVLARWDYGGYIESVAQRPSIATNYGTETYGMEAVARFFTASDEKEMAAALDANKVRYLIIDKVLGDLPMYGKLIGSSKQFFAEQPMPGGGTMYVPTSESLDLVVSRLFLADGSLTRAAGVVFLPVENVRLVYESKSTADVEGFPLQVRKIKVFEYSKGAEVVVRGTPGEIVTFSLPVETNQGRRFDFRSKKRIGDEGTATFKLLYPPKKWEACGAIGPASIGYQGRFTTVSYDENDVTSGRRFPISE